MKHHTSGLFAAALSDFRAQFEAVDPDAIPYTPAPPELIEVAREGVRKLKEETNDERD